MSLRCECGNTEDFYWDYDSGEVVCRKCGLVIVKILNRWHYDVFWTEDQDQEMEEYLKHNLVGKTIMDIKCQYTDGKHFLIFKTKEKTVKVGAYGQWIC